MMMMMKEEPGHSWGGKKRPDVAALPRALENGGFTTANTDLWPVHGKAEGSEQFLGKRSGPDLKCCGHQALELLPGVLALPESHTKANPRDGSRS